MATKRITAGVLDAMAPGDTVWDAEVRGFGVRFRTRDRIYVLKARINGRQRMLTIGRHGRGFWGPESARREAQRLLGLIRAGLDPAAQRDADRRTPTVEAFADRFLVEYSAVHHKRRSGIEAAGLLRRYVRPALGKLRLRDVTRADVARLHAGMRRTPAAANRALALLSAMFGWAERIGERPDGSNPCRHVDRFAEKPRERLLTAAELARLGDALDHAARPWTQADLGAWRAACAAQAEAAHVAPGAVAAWVEARQPRRLSAEDWRAVAAVRLLIFTGARLNEVLGLQWAWLDLGAGVAHLPDSKTGRKDVYLPAGALEVLAALPRFAGSPFVLPGDRPDRPFVGLHHPWSRLRALAGLPGVRLHDLRHAFASVGVAGGDSLFIVGKLLGHRTAATTARYAHLAPDPAKATADRIGERLRAMLAGDAAEVVKVPRRPKS